MMHERYTCSKMYEMMQNVTTYTKPSRKTSKHSHERMHRANKFVEVENRACEKMYELKQ